MSVPIEYRISDPHAYLYNYIEPERMLEAVAYQYLTEYAAGVELSDFMGPERGKINADLKTNIQARVDELELGITIVFVGIRGAHPPAENNVAAAFQGVLAAENKKYAMINAARGEARKIRTGVVGTEARALALDEAILAANRLKSANPVDEVALAAAEQRVDELLLGNPAKGITPASGRASVEIAQARATSVRRVATASAKARVFATEVAALEAAPALYRGRKKLQIYKDLAYVRKYLIIGDSSNVIIEYEMLEEGGLDRILSEGLETERKQRLGK